MQAHRREQKADPLPRATEKNTNAVQFNSSHRLIQDRVLQRPWPGRRRTERHLPRLRRLKSPPHRRHPRTSRTALAPVVQDLASDNETSNNPVDDPDIHGPARDAPRRDPETETDLDTRFRNLVQSPLPSRHSSIYQAPGPGELKLRLMMQTVRPGCGWTWRTAHP